MSAQPGACSIFTAILCYRTTVCGQEFEGDGCLARLTTSLSHLLHQLYLKAESTAKIPSKLHGCKKRGSALTASFFLVVDKRGPRLSTVPHMSRLFNSLHGSWHSFGPGQLARTQKTARLNMTHSTRQNAPREFAYSHPAQEESPFSHVPMSHILSFDLQAKEQCLVCFIYWHRQEPPRTSTHPFCPTVLQVISRCVPELWPMIVKIGLVYNE